MMQFHFKDWQNSPGYSSTDIKYLANVVLRLWRFFEHLYLDFESEISATADVDKLTFPFDSPPINLARMKRLKVDAIVQVK